MTQSELSRSVFETVSEERLVDLARRMIRIPSFFFEEHEVADFLADYLTDLGLDIRMMEVEHPWEEGRTTRQPIATLRGTGGGSSLMVNGHIDTNVLMSGWTVDPYEGKLENGWLWGLGAQDDKGGLAAAIAGVAAIVEAGVELRGDIVFCPVAAHKLGGTGTRTALRKGVRADCCINIEHAANTLGTVVTGSVRVKIATTTPGLFFRFTPEARSGYTNAIELQAELIRRFGPSLTNRLPNNWLTHTPHPELTDFPMIRYDTIHKDHYGRECDLMFQVRTIPGMTVDTVREDVQRVLDGINDLPNLDYTLTVPANGPDDPYHMEPMKIAHDHPLVKALAEGQELASGRPAELGSVERIGNYGDGNVLAAAGIPSIQYGPGDIKVYPEWPAPDERVEVSELMVTARAIAHTALRICG